MCGKNQFQIAHIQIANSPLNTIHAPTVCNSFLLNNQIACIRVNSYEHAGFILSLAERHLYSQRIEFRYLCDFGLACPDCPAHTP